MQMEKVQVKNSATWQSSDSDCQLQLSIEYGWADVTLARETSEILVFISIFQ